MIKAKISQNFPHHNITSHIGDIYVADYTNQVKNLLQKRSVETHTIKPKDIDSFLVENPTSLEIGNIIFDNNSFKYSNGNSKSQCETCFFPYNANDESWILFAELKYTTQEINNYDDIVKAIKQLYRTRGYYLQKGIFNKTKNRCYLIVSLPKQKTPFTSFTQIMPSNRIAELKVKHNIILRGSNTIKVSDDKILL